MCLSWFSLNAFVFSFLLVRFALYPRGRLGILGIFRLPFFLPLFARLNTRLFFRLNFLFSLLNRLFIRLLSPSLLFRENLLPFLSRPLTLTCLYFLLPWRILCFLLCLKLILLPSFHFSRLVFLCLIFFHFPSLCMFRLIFLLFCLTRIFFPFLS